MIICYCGCLQHKLKKCQWSFCLPLCLSFIDQKTGRLERERSQTGLGARLAWLISCGDTRFIFISIYCNRSMLMCLYMKPSKFNLFFLSLFLPTLLKKKGRLFLKSHFLLIGYIWCIMGFWELDVLHLLGHKNAWHLDRMCGYWLKVKQFMLYYLPEVFSLRYIKLKIKNFT